MIVLAHVLAAVERVTMCLFFVSGGGATECRCDKFQVL